MSMSHYEDAYKLLSANLAPFAGDVTFDRLYARSALASSRPAEALLALERAVAVGPDSAEVHVDMGRAYYDLSQWQAAKVEFESVLPAVSDQHQRKVVVDYLRIINTRLFKRQRAFSAFMEIGGGGDNNANAAPRIEKFMNFTLNDTSRQLTSQQLFTRMQGAMRSDINLYNQISNYLYFAQNWYPEATFVNNAMLGAGATLTSKYGGGSNYLSLQAFRTDLAEKFNNTGRSVSYTYSRNISDNAQWDLGANYGQIRFVKDYAIKDNDQISINLHGRYLVPTQTPFIIDLSVKGGKEDTLDSTSPYSQDYVNSNVSFSARNQASEIFFNGSYTYHEFPSRFFGTFRSDQTTEISLGMNLNLQRSWQLRPTLSTQRNLSSVGLYEYRRTIAGIAIRRDFL